MATLGAFWALFLQLSNLNAKLSVASRVKNYRKTSLLGLQNKY